VHDEATLLRAASAVLGIGLPIWWVEVLGYLLRLIGLTVVGLIGLKNRRLSCHLSFLSFSSLLSFKFCPSFALFFKGD
jgi:hypothetical protein